LQALYLFTAIKLDIFGLQIQEFLEILDFTFKDLQIFTYKSEDLLNFESAFNHCSLKAINFLAETLCTFSI